MASLKDLLATLYEFAILLKQAVSPPQQLLASTERVVQLGFEVLWLVVWPRHGAESLYFGPTRLSMYSKGVLA